MSTPLLIAVLGMIAVNAVLRSLPVTLLSGKELPEALLRWLSFVPVTVLAALLVPELLIRNGSLRIAPDNLFLLATFPTLLVTWRTRSFFGAMATGMGVVALARLFWPHFFI